MKSPVVVDSEAGGDRSLGEGPRGSKGDKPAGHRGHDRLGQEQKTSVAVSISSRPPKNNMANVLEIMASHSERFFVTSRQSPILTPRSSLLALSENFRYIFALHLNDHYNSLPSNNVFATIAKLITTIC